MIPYVKIFVIHSVYMYHIIYTRACVRVSDAVGI